MGGYFFLLKEMIVNIITVKAVRNIPICVKSLSVMYTASPPFKVLSHLREIELLFIVSTFKSAVKKSVAYIMLLKGGTENRGTRSPDVQGFPREYFSILSGRMQLFRT